MKCVSKFSDITYGSDLFCNTCGMDIGLNPIRVRHKDTIRLYCCDECVQK